MVIFFLFPITSLSDSNSIIPCKLALSFLSLSSPILQQISSDLFATNLLTSVYSLDVNQNNYAKIKTSHDLCKYFGSQFPEKKVHPPQHDYEAIHNFAPSNFSGPIFCSLTLFQPYIITSRLVQGTPPGCGPVPVHQSSHLLGNGTYSRR